MLGDAIVTGFDVARFASKVIPDLRVIYMSGETLGSSLGAGE